MALTLAALDTFFRIDPRQPETFLANGLPGTKGYKRAAMVLRTTVLIYYKRHSGDFYFTKVTVSLQKKECVTQLFYRISILPDPSSRDTYFFSKTLLIASLNACLGIAPVAIWGLSFMGINNIEGMLRIPNKAANSCSFSVLTL